MSKLYYTENGHLIPSLGEEITRFRRARKVLTLPNTGKPATVYLDARTYTGSTVPLRMAVNGREVEPILPSPRDHYRWYETAVDPSLLVAGTNTFDFWCDTTAMNAWSLALEAGHAEPDSYVSDDGGTTWRNHHMGYLNIVRCEYLLRVRLAEGRAPAPPPMVWDDPASPRSESLKWLVPQAAREPGPIMDRARALTTWLASSWEHTGADVAAQNTPWDPETILDWAPAQRGHNGQRPIANCIFYGVTFTSACQAVGIPARCAVFADKPDGRNGHFVAEFWAQEHEKWVMVDPNTDAHFIKDGVPMSVSEVQKSAPDLESLIEFGPGIDAQRRNPRLSQWFQDGYLDGSPFRHRSAWYRADLLTHPEHSPPGHGAGIAYSETGIVWEERDRELWGMFPHFGSPNYFDAPPPLDT